MDLREQLQATLTGSYTLERELGGGGMSRVFVAEDTRLGRKVVVKVLPPEMAGSISVERFTREIQVAARLQHPHIVPLLSAGEISSDGHNGTALPYYTMPLVLGESLRSRIARDGRLSVEESTRLVSEVADALEYAHGQGVVHRDIKPENILLSGGHALVLDFGIAKALDVSRTNADHSVTATGMSLGTPAYMSPEQAAGESAIDARSDIYSLAAVLYEMLSGGPAFAGPTAMAVMAKRFSGPPAALRTHDSSIPSGIEHAVGRAMSMERDARFATAAEFRTALTAQAAARTPPVASDEKSIAVLPFANMSAEAESEYFSDGLSEEIINALAHLPGLRVAARTSSFAFKGKHMDVAEIGEKLKVATVLEGSVRRAGKRVRITVQLIKAADGYHLWSERYDRDLEDVFAIQDEIARAIAEQLKVKLLTAHDTLIRPGTNNVEAYDCYLKGRHHLARRGGGLRQAVEYFTRAIAIDSEFAAAYAGLADAEMLLLVYGYVRGRDNEERARDAAERAMALGASQAEPHFSVAMFNQWIAYDFVLAEREFRRAAELNPSWAVPQVYLSVLLGSLGRHVESMQFAKAAVRLEPLSALVQGLASLNFRRMDLALAVECAERAVEFNPLSPLSQWAHGWTMQLRGAPSDAVADLERAVEYSARAPLLVAYLGVALAQAGEQQRAHGLWEELMSRDVHPWLGAMLQWHLGDAAGAIAEFERGASERAGGCAIVIAPLPPGSEELAKNPGWQSALERAGIGAIARGAIQTALESR